MKDKILLVWDRLGDYHRARAEALRMLGYEVATADLGAQDGLYEWQSSMLESHYCLSPREVDAPDFGRRLRRFARLLRTLRPKAVGLSGYGRTSYMAMAVLARMMGVRVVMFAESWYPSGKWRERFKAWFVRHWVSGLLVSGQRAADYFGKNLGLQGIIPIRIGYSAVDNSHFAQQVQVTRNMAEYPHLLMVARFATEKNHERIIEAFLESKASEHFYLKMVGAGELMGSLQQRYGAKDRLIFRPWVQYGDLPGLYQQASGLVLGSTFEPWGLVVNEAMAAGLPVLLSDECGCQPELGKPTNSLRFSATKPQEIRAAFDRWAALTPEARAAAGAESRKIVADFGCEAWAERFIQLI